MANIKPYITDLKRHQDGIIIGALVGFGSAYYAINYLGVDWVTLTSAGKGLLDSMMARNAAVEVAAYKVYSVFTVIGSMMGFIVSKVMDRFMGK